MYIFAENLPRRWNPAPVGFFKATGSIVLQMGDKSCNDVEGAGVTKVHSALV